jgi:hypothetical protein
MLQVFLLTLQTINIVDRNIPLIGITSAGIACAWLINVGGARAGWKTRVAFVVGGSLGAMMSIPFHTFIQHYRI